MTRAKSENIHFHNLPLDRACIEVISCYIEDVATFAGSLGEPVYLGEDPDVDESERVALSWEQHMQSVNS